MSSLRPFAPRFRLDHKQRNSGRSYYGNNYHWMSYEVRSGEENHRGAHFQHQFIGFRLVQEGPCGDDQETYGSTCTSPRG